MKKAFKITINVVMEEEAALLLGDRLTRLFQNTGLSELIGDNFDVTITYADGSELFSAKEDYDMDLLELAKLELADGPIDTSSLTLQLEVADLLVNDVDSGMIKVSKDIFDDFTKGTAIDIEFVDDNPGIVHTYQMVSEDADGITMVYLGSQ